MVHEARKLSAAQRAAAELLLGRPLKESEALSVQAFDPAPVSERRQREIADELRKLFAEVDRNLNRGGENDADEIFTEAMRTSRPGYRDHR